jgi:hypothetical protein
MSQLLYPLPDTCTYPLLCHYANLTAEIQVIRIANVACWYFERIVFPGQQLMFEAVLGAQLEVYVDGGITERLADAIACEDIACQPFTPPGRVEGNDAYDKQYGLTATVLG